MTKLPIRLRVTAAFALAMAAVLAGSAWFLYDRLGSHLELALNRELELRAQDLTTLARQPGASFGAGTAGKFVEHGESYAQLLDLQNRVVDATRPLEKASLLSPPELKRARRGVLFADRRAIPGLDEPSRLLATPVSRSGRPLVLIVGATRQDRAETLASFRDELLIAGPIALLLASIAGYFLAGFSLRQVESMRRRAAGVSAETPGERLPVPRTGDELERLGATLNEMLDRLEDGLQRERDFAADAGHELRTPLALLRTELELALRHGSSAEELRTALQGSAQEVDRLTQLAEDLLLIARTDRGRLPLRLERLDATELLGGVATRFQWRADAERRELIVEARRVLIVGDRLRLEQALSNLVDNALRHGRGAVRLRAATANGTVELHVQDEGPGFDPRFIERAFERFSRSRPGRDGSGGSGLGLSIVEAIAAAHGGEANARNRAEGGADVWIELGTGSPRST